MSPLLYRGWEPESPSHDTARKELPDDEREYTKALHSCQIDP